MNGSMFQVPRSGFVFSVPVPCSRFIVRRSVVRSSYGPERLNVARTLNIERRTVNSNLNTNQEPGTRNAELQCIVYRLASR